MENQLEMPKQEVREVRRPWRRQIVIACAVLLVAVALALNFTLFGGTPGTTDGDEAPAGDQVGSNETPTDTSVDGYFSAAQVSRPRARDEALEVLQSVVDSTDADEAMKNEALESISAIADEIQKEANIESLITSKGFSQCVAVLNGDTATIVVSADSLQPADLAQINVIVYEQPGILPAGITIVHK